MPSEEQTNEQERMKTIVLGRQFGTHTGWDDIDQGEIMFYNFEATAAFPQIKFDGTVDLTVYYTTGKAEVTDEDAKVLATIDLVTLLANTEPEA